MNVGEIITYIMLVFAIIGCIDKAFGSKFGFGNSFERALSSIGPLILAMVGPMAAAPLIAKYVAPALAPVCTALGIDPSVTAGLLFASDAGGWPLATALAQDELVGKFAGSVMASMMGCTILGAFPLLFMLIPKEKITLAAKGLTIGFITIPFGCFIGGLCTVGLNIGKLLLNMLPVIALSALFVVGLTFFEKATLKIVTIFGYVITALVLFVLGATMVIKVLKLNVTDLDTFDNSLLIIGGIAIFLCGAFVFLDIVQKLFGKYFGKIGEKIGLDEASVIGLVTTVVNAIPMFDMTKKMSDRGVIVNIAFLVCASYVMGDHLAFQTAVDTSMAVPLIVGKLSGGILGVIIALYVTRPKKEKTA